MTSIWMDHAAPLASSAPLRGRLEVDVVVVGAGITGVMVAHRLHGAGLKVALLEAGRVGASNTGGSTGNLYAPVSSGMAALLDRWDAEVLRRVADTRRAAISAIERCVQEHRIDCGLVRCPLACAVQAPDPVQLDRLDEEMQAYAVAGLAPVADAGRLPFPVARAFRIEGQAQFNPFLFARGMAGVLAGRGVAVHEQSPVLDLDPSRGEATTLEGVVAATHIVLATHTPLGFNLVQAEMEVYREYGIAMPVDRPVLDEGIHWIRDRGRSLRPWRHDGREWLVVVGEKHRTGEGEDGVDYRARLAGDARNLFPVGEVEAGWSAQQFKPADGLPYIGRSGHDNVWMATGFGADGLTWGAVAASLLADAIQDRPSPDARLFDPRRFTPLKSAKGWASENATVTRHLVGDRLRRLPKGLEAVPPGEGRLVEEDGERYAVYRDDAGQVTVLSPVCPHMKCLVRWNGAERSWDCPCHGSRFTTQGEVIEGPALSGLTLHALPGRA